MRFIYLIILLFAYVINTDAAGAVLNNNSSAPVIKSTGSNLSSPTTAPSPPTVTTATSTTSSSILPQVLEAYNPVEEPYRNRFRLGSSLIVKVENLQALKDLEAAKNKKIILYISKVPIKGLFRTSLNTFTGELRFVLTRDNNTKAGWDQLICRPRLQIAPAEITVGFEDDYSIPTKVTDTNAMIFDVINPKGFAGWVVFCAALASLFLYMGKKTSLLRAAGIDSTFSLASSQMAFWTFLVCSAYVLIYLITFEMPNLNSSILILLGLSAGTALSGKIIDAGKQAPPTSGSFLDDILQDADGYTIARLQIFLWTIITGAIFISNIYNKLAMPEFSDTLLTLMGISSGTYLGFKFPEAKTPQPAMQPTPGSSTAQLAATDAAANSQNDDHQAMG